MPLGFVDSAESYINNAIGIEKFEKSFNLKDENFLTDIDNRVCYSFFLLQAGGSPAKQIRELNQSDTFYFELPKREGKFDSSLYQNIQKYTKELSLTSLERGFDSIQIRVSYGGPMTGERLVILTNKENKWSAEISKIITEVNPGFEDSINVDSWEKYSLIRTIDYKTPKSGWDKFIKNLFNLNILSLPDEENIANFKKESPTDGVGVFVEVSTKKAYRGYGYSDPDYYLYELKYEFAELKQISQILKLVDEEFDLEKLWDYTNEEHHENTPDTIRKVKMQEIQLEDVKPEKKKRKK